MASNIADRLNRVVRRHILTALPLDHSGELEQMPVADLLMTYGNWRGRFVTQSTRAVHVARELTAELSSSPHWTTAVNVVLNEIRVGVDLSPRLSSRVKVAYVPDAERKTGGGLDLDLDAFLAHDGLHHLHLGSQKGGEFVSRTDDLLVVAFEERAAYVVGVYPHGAWGRRDVLERMVRNWPDARLLAPMAGISRLDKDLTDDERWQLMKAGATVLIEIDGRVYVPPGQTTARTPSAVTQRVHAYMREVDELRKLGVDEYVRLRGARTNHYWSPVVRDEEVGLESIDGFVPLGRLV